MSTYHSRIISYKTLLDTTDNIKINIEVMDTNKIPYVGAVVIFHDTSGNELKNSYGSNIGYEINSEGKSSFSINKNLIPLKIYVIYVGCERFIFSINDPLDINMEVCLYCGMLAKPVPNNTRKTYDVRLRELDYNFIPPKRSVTWYLVQLPKDRRVT